MNFSLLPTDDDWVVEQAPALLTPMTPLPGICVATASSEIFLNRVKGIDKTVSMIFSPGERGHLGAVEVMSNAKFCEIYVQEDSKEWTYVETCRGVLIVESCFQCHREGPKLPFSNLKLKFLSMKTSPDTLKISALKITFTRSPSLTEVFPLESTDMGTSSPCSTSGGGEMLSAGFVSAAEAIRVQMLRDLSGMMEEKLQPVLSQVYLMDRRLHALEMQNEKILNGLAALAASASSSPGEHSVELTREGRQEESTKHHAVACHTDSNDAGATLEGTDNDTTDMSKTVETGDSVDVLHCTSGEDGVGFIVDSELKYDMKQLMTLLRESQIT